LARRFAELCQRIVVKDTVGKYNPVKAKAGNRKLIKALEFEERRESAEKFMKMWNTWREFYFQAAPLEIKTSGQLTMIENAITHFKEKNIPINLVIACLHKSYQRSKNFRPSFSELVSKGEEKYNSFLDAVESDVEMSEMERISLGDD